MISTKVLTLCIVHQPPRVLLGMKKRGFGAGRWNGFGGKVHDGETIEGAARRELMEETGIAPVDLVPAGMLEFSWQQKPEEALDVRLFRVTDFEGEPQESEEMRPQWFREDEIPFDRMWQDDRHWMPLFLQGKKFRGRFVFNDRDQIVEGDLYVVE